MSLRDIYRSIYLYVEKILLRLLNQVERYSDKQDEGDDETAIWEFPSEESKHQQRHSALIPFDHN